MTHAMPPHQQPQWMPPTGPPPPTPKAKRKKWPWIVAAVVGVLVVASAIGGGDQPATQNTPGTPSGASSNTDGQPAGAPQSEPVEEDGTFGPGTHEVGVDIQPGKYKTQGGGLGGSCYWARLKDTDGDFDSIITNGNAQGPTTVTIKAGDGAFETTCETWTKADR